ncbi:reverse transcriptase domain-containing protein [Bacillus subtilis]|uniref:reverse transcriptase domain-containing protein n=1 Tax=Bacillus subtilis TaxID=1423 RepID=UPI001431ED13|nr:reverse transcriptase domain-containing protein [Bacillus subtilis]NJI52769.1 RNA-directed DNA polymerase [Bacillus subtilis]UQZ57317.1 hypothetical protein C2H93_01580 [Bacillus subtilis]
MNFPRNDFEKYARDEGKSQQFIDATLSYVDKLNSMQLPVIFSIKHLALTLDYPYNKILDIANHSEKYYKSFKIRKKRNPQQFRRILAPNPDLKVIQRWIYNNILKNIEPDESSVGFSQGCSIQKAAAMHTNQEVVLRVDLSNFFENITQKQVYYVFRNLGYHKNLAVDLAKLTTIYTKEGSYLPQGAPTSPALSNLVVRKMDKRLRCLSEKLGVNYTRYADDLIISGNKKDIPRLGLIKQIIKEEGFKLNSEKTAIQRAGNKQLVLGLTVTNGVHVPKDFKKEIWTHLRYCKKYGPIDHLRYINKSDKGAFKDWLFGKISFVKSVEPAVGEKMMNLFNEINWPL